MAGNEDQWDSGAVLSLDYTERHHKDPPLLSTTWLVYWV